MRHPPGNLLAVLYCSTYSSLSLYSSEHQIRFCKTGVFPFNLDVVFAQPTAGVLPPRPASVGTPHRVIFNTPIRARHLLTYTNIAIQLLGKAPDNPVSEITAQRNLAHIAERAWATAEIKTIEAEDIKKKYQGKKAAKSDRRGLSKARVVTGAEVMRLREAKYEGESQKSASRNASPKGLQGEGTHSGTISNPHLPPLLITL